MATTLTVQVPTADSALEATYVAVTATMEFVNTGRELIHVKNGVTEMVLAVNRVNNCNQGFDHDPSETVTASEDRFLGPYSKGEFNDGDGKVQITLDDVNDGTIAVIRTSI